MKRRGMFAVMDADLWVNAHVHVALSQGVHIMCLVDGGHVFVAGQGDVTPHTQRSLDLNVPHGKSSGKLDRQPIRDGRGGVGAEKGMAQLDFEQL